MSGNATDKLFGDQKTDCQHYVIRKRRRGGPHEFAFNAYVCGNCAKVFEVKEYHEPEPPKEREPMFPKHSVPWGFRDRQA